jgi:dipeptidyl aminopeptidase B
MLLPDTNIHGYERSAITNTTALGLATRFFVAHGTGDDNVHIQNSLVLMDALVSGGVENWDSQVFTDDDHNINFHGGRRAIFSRLAEWLIRHFGRKEVGGKVWRVEDDL